jgi:hypothetical protein
MRLFIPSEGLKTVVGARRLGGCRLSRIAALVAESALKDVAKHQRLTEQVRS